MGTFTLSPLCVLSLFSAAIFPANLGGQRAESLREATRGRFMIGAAVTAAQLDRPETADLILKQFNHLTAEYEFMPLFMETGPGRFDFKRSDRIVDFAHLHHLPLTGHMLCWHQITPQWMFEDAEHHPLPRERALANLKLYINTVVTHFRGKLDSWNVVNEAVSDKPLEYLRDNPALRSIGIDYVQKAFEFAHAADPNVPLYYNDYNVEDQAKLPKVLRLIRSLKKEGVRLDAVGIPISLTLASSHSERRVSRFWSPSWTSTLLVMKEQTATSQAFLPMFSIKKPSDMQVSLRYS